MNNIKTYRQRNNPETQRDRIPNYYEDAICPVYYFLCLTTEAKSHQNEKTNKQKHLLAESTTLGSSLVGAEVDRGGFKKQLQLSN